MPKETPLQRALRRVYSAPVPRSPVKPLYQSEVKLPDTSSETLQARIDAALADRQPVDPTGIVYYNGEPYKVEDLPSADLRALSGYGHFPPFQRPVVERLDDVTWPYTPNMCLVAEGIKGVWVDDQHLVCPGCGLDCT